ncbi:unnamed protein product [Auanema sp. JU1783]|nr:unnamed protein product [Auanema sp. JU1783]
MTSSTSYAKKKFSKVSNAPVYMPTCEEFKDPIRYVTQIRPEAEKYGIIRIIPPPNFDPPFCVKPKKFKFTPRIQRLHEVDALAREKLFFKAQIVRFWEYQGFAYEPLQFDNRVVDEFELQEAVDTFVEQTCESDKSWALVAKKLGFKAEKQAEIRKFYCKYLKPYKEFYIRFSKSNDEIVILEDPVVPEPEESKDSDDSQDSQNSQDSQDSQNSQNSQDSKEDVKDIKDIKDIKVLETEQKDSISRKNSKSHNSKNPDAPTIPETKITRMSRASMQGVRKANNREARARRGRQRVAVPCPSSAPESELRPRRVKQEETLGDDEEEKRKARRYLSCSRCDSVEPRSPKDKRCYRCNKVEHHCCRGIPLRGKPDETWHCYTCILALMYEQGNSYGFYDSDCEYTLDEFATYANDFKKSAFDKELNEITVGEVEEKFWEYVLEGEETSEIKYGADLITSKVGSGFPKKDDKDGSARLDRHYVNHAWNLNNMPLLHNSVFSHMNTHISGMMVPWVYVGMCFSTFCWHTEDHWTYSVNYNHWGEPKVWYGIPGDQAEKFEKIVREIAPHTTTFQKDVFHYMATAVNPTFLKERGIDIYTVHQHAREFVITFPRAYHSGFNCGVNFAEAVNFAPYDWLFHGRDSMDNYATVRRPSVFSYEELMVRASHGCKAMAVEMAEVVEDHIKLAILRGDVEEVFARDVKATRVELEDYINVPEEFRACRYCKTVCAHMSVECPHGRITCVEHHRFLCPDCSGNDVTLNVWDVELEDKLLIVSTRLSEFKQWTSRLDIAYSQKPKPSVQHFKQLLVEGELLESPCYERYLKLIEDIKHFQFLIEQAEVLLAEKIRTRQETRAQRADTRPTSEQLKDLYVKMLAASCDFGELFLKLKERHEAVSAWQETVATALEIFQTNINTPTLQLESLISRGESFDLRLTELDDLKKCCRILEWKKKADELMNWRCRINMEDEESFLSKTRNDLPRVLSLIREGTDLAKKYPLLDLVTEINLKYKTAVELEEEVSSLRYAKTIAMDVLEETWRKCRDSDWCNAPGLDWFRREYMQAREYCKESSIEGICLIECHSQVEKCQKSCVLAATSYYKERLLIRDSGYVFTEKLASLFLKTTSYYTLGEILNEREDIIPLVEGRNVPMKIHKFTEPILEWESIIDFDSFLDVQNNFDFLREQRRKLLGTLNNLNEKKLVSQTCACLSMKEDSVICCLLCKAKNHVSCCRWDVFLESLPEGTYLCVRCLRSCRPSIKDVNQVCQFAHEKSVEGELVRVLAHAAKENSLKVKSTANTLIKSKSKVWPDEFRIRALAVVEDFLSLEVSEPNVLKDLSQLIKFLFKDVLEKQKGLCAKLKYASVKSNPPKVLFAEQKGKGRKSSDLDAPNKKKRLRSDQLHDDKDLCAFKACVRPSVKKVGWVQCECCGCWYHLVCVGLTFETVNAIEIYKCGTC